MSNPYLEKAASLHDFYRDLSGRHYNELKTRKHHLEVAMANKETPRSLGRRADVAARRMWRARAQTAGAAGLIVGGTIAGATAYTHHQNEKIRQNIRDIMTKQAGMFDSIARGAKGAANKVLDTANTAHGGKIATFGESLYGRVGKNAKQWDRGDFHDRVSMVSSTHPDKVDELRSLRKKQQTAKVGLYGSTAAAVGATYAVKKGTTPNESTY